MVELWFALLGVMLIAYVVLDGFDFGAGALHLFIAKSDRERRAVLAAIGPFWDGNEVWLIATGGVLFVAFPELLSTAFPAFYLALHLVLWCLVLRGIAIEVRSHLEDGMWSSFWDATFAAVSTLLAFLFGVAFGNLIRGVPLGERREFTMPLFSDFRPWGAVGLLDYYSISVGLLSVAVLAAHAATFLSWRTQGALRERALGAERTLWRVAFGALALVTLETHFVRPELLPQLARRPLAIAAVVITISGVLLRVRARRNGRDGRAFLGSCATIAGILAAAGAAHFPIFLRSTLSPAFDLVARANPHDSIAMKFALGWWPFAFMLAVSYFVNVFRANRARVGAED